MVTAFEDLMDRLVECAAASRAGQSKYWWRGVSNTAHSLANALLNPRWWVEISRTHCARHLCSALSELLKAALYGSSVLPEDMELEYIPVRPRAAYELLRAGANLCLKHDVSISEYYAKSPGEIARAYARSGYQQLPTVVDEAARRRLLDVNKREVWRSGFLGSALQLIEYITLSTSLAATTAQSHPDIPFSLPQLRVLHVAVEGLASAGVDSKHLKSKASVRAIASAILHLCINTHPVLGWAWNTSPRVASRDSPARRIPEDVHAPHNQWGDGQASDADRVESWTLRACIVEEGVKVLWDLRGTGVGIGAWSKDACTLRLGTDIVPALLVPFNEVIHGSEPTLLGLAPFSGAKRNFVEADLDVLAEAAALLLSLARGSEGIRQILRVPIVSVDPTSTGADILTSFADQSQLPPAWRVELGSGRALKEVTEQFERCQDVILQVLEVVRNDSMERGHQRRAWWRRMLCL